MTSRPSSRASQPTRPSSSLSSTAGIPRNVSATPSHKFGGLSEKQLSKISLNIASARKSTTDLRHKAGLSSAIVKEDEPLASSKPAATAKINNNAFIHSAAFSEAPLKSRVPPASPRRDMLKTPKPDRTASALAKPEELPMLRGTSLEIQEALLIEDLLFVLMGVEGQYIAFHEDYSPEDEADRLKGARFVVDEEMDASLRHLVERVLPVATYYTAIDTFVEQHSHLEYGLINHALCAAIRDVTREYLVLVAQLEHLFQTAPTFTLRQFWLYIQESLDKLSLTYTLVQDLLAAPEEAVESEAEEDSDSDLSDASGPGAEGVKALLKQMKASGSTKALSAWKQGGIVKGGEVLCVIEEHLQQSAGNPSAVALYSTLLLKASQPYMATLLKWIGSGRLSDPHDEFMIRETKSITRGSLEMDYVDEYWERRYTLKDQPVVASTSEPLPETVIPERPTSALSGRKAAREKGLGGGGVIPSFLEPLKAKILLAGKYLNVIRECGIGIQIPQEVIDGLGQRLIAMHDPGFYDRIAAAYTYANRTLLTLLLNDRQLLSRLGSIKHHFFMDQGDAFTHFLDSAHHELSKKSKHVSITKLQSLLDIAIRNSSSSSSTDPFKEDVKVALMSTTLTEFLMRIANVSGAIGALEPEGLDSFEPTKSKEEEKVALTGIDAFTLDYHVAFPLSLIISRKTILRYQLIFRHLLHMKHLEQVLTGVWVEQTKSPTWRKRTPYGQLEHWKFRVMALRSKMFGFVKEMYGFAVCEVLEPNWRALQVKLVKAETVDGLLRDHTDFLDTCLKECMLTNAKLLKLQQKLLHIITLFTSYTSFITKSISTAQAELEANAGDWASINFEKAETAIKRFESNYNHHAKVHADVVSFVASSDSVALLPLVVRLLALN